MVNRISNGVFCRLRFEYFKSFISDRMKQNDKTYLLPPKDVGSVISFKQITENRNKQYFVVLFVVFSIVKLPIANINWNTKIIEENVQKFISGNCFLFFV